MIRREHFGTTKFSILNDPKEAIFFAIEVSLG